MGEHGLDRPADGEPEGGEGSGALREQRAGDGSQRPGEHDGAPDLVARCSGGVRQGVDRDGVQCSLAHLPGEQSAQEVLLLRGGRA